MGKISIFGAPSMGGLVLMEISMVNWTDGNGNLSKIPTASFFLFIFTLLLF